MSAPLGSIVTWSDAQLAEDVNDEDGISAMKYNEWRRQAKACKEEAERCQAEEQQRVEMERRRAKEQAKKCVSHFCFVMTELTVSGRGGCCATARKGQGKGVRGTGLQPVCGARARVRTRAW